jgi:glycosyltransferase involved in cell wall biosynthesis
MVRVLHLLSASADYQTETAVAQLTRGNDPDLAAEIRTIGPGGATYSNGVAGVIGLRRRGAAADLIHAWGESSLFVAAVGGKHQIIYTPSEFPRCRAIRWLRSIMEYRSVQVVCPTDTMRRAFVEHGVPIERCHLIRPSVDSSLVKPRRDPEIRSALGFDDQDQVVLAVGESTRAADHPRAAWAAVVLHVLDRRNRLLLWGRGALSQKTSRFVARLQQEDLCAIATERLGRTVTFEQLLPAADVALITATSPVATLPIAVCMAAGLPIVAVVSSTVSELLEDRHNAMLVSSDSPRAIARRILDLREDSSLEWKLRDTARAEAYEYFSQTRFVQQYRDVYRQADAGERVEVSEPAPGAGSRFHNAV